MTQCFSDTGLALDVSEIVCRAEILLPFLNNYVGTLVPAPLFGSGGQRRPEGLRIASHP